MPAVAHIDEVRAELPEAGALSGHWRDLGAQAGSATVGLLRGVLAPDARSSAAQLPREGEGFVVVLRGSGRVERGAERLALAPGDCALLPPGDEGHTLVAGDAGLDVLVWGPAAGSAARAGRVVGLADVAEEPEEHGHHAYRERDFGDALGSRVSGLRHVTIRAGREGIPPHCHALEEELFVVLAGEGGVWLDGAEHAVTPGSVVARPAGTGVCHHFEAGAGGDLVYLAYGERRLGETIFYARSGMAYLRGIRRLVATEPMRPYWDLAT